MICPGARTCALYKDNGTEPTADQEPQPAKSDQVFELGVTSIGEGVLVEVAITERTIVLPLKSIPPCVSASGPAPSFLHWPVPSRLHR